MTAAAPIPRKSLGQHWLDDAASLWAIAETLPITKTDTVLEIGPGPGALTRQLVQRADQVIAVEFDQTLARQLPQRVPVDNLQVIEQDILSFDFNELPTNYYVVANIPYYLTSHLIRVISETTNPPLAAALLVQKEVAERIAAQPSAMSLLSVTAQYYWQVSTGQVIKAELFTPPPKVDSQVIILQRRSTPLFADTVSKDFFRLVKAGFAQRRKTLANSLSAGLHIDRDVIIAACESASIDPRRRAQTLSLEEWHGLLQATPKT